ncbi:MAG: hypothetical protein M0P91_00955 [Sulfuricurvum sp.]|jgi:hypothetical protein|uniref:hypothetical protein n=1 Tax=Sulfuricurvum sp. TaxID=2025608 RepID=UPI0025EDCF18|nr:hypothetical protein [Sulfuricurvum sp.]MCK9371737.1 hypothetical protein [Sulfuricurvum sp.]
MRFFILIASTLLLLAGCSGHSAVAPSQNSALQAISPSTTAVSEGGRMQHALDLWLKNEWAPLTGSGTPADAASVSAPEVSHSSVPLKTENSASQEEDTFTLQHYVDKWERYNENKKKQEESQKQEPSHIDVVKQIPIIGK